MRLAKQLEELTHLEARVTILGYVQRGGTPSVADRLLATRLGTACAGFIHEGVFGVMVAARGDGVKAVPIGEVAGRLKTVPARPPMDRSRAPGRHMPGRLRATATRRCLRNRRRPTDARPGNRADRRLQASDRTAHALQERPARFGRVWRGPLDRSPRALHPT